MEIGAKSQAGRSDKCRRMLWTAWQTTRRGGCHGKSTRTWSSSLTNITTAALLVILCLWQCQSLNASTVSTTRQSVPGGASTTILGDSATSLASASSTSPAQWGGVLFRSFHAIYLLPLFIFVFLALVVLCSYWNMIGFPLKYLK